MPKRRGRQVSRDSNDEENQRVFTAVLLLCIFIFLAGRECGANRIEGKVETLQKQVVNIEERVRDIEYPGETKYIWPMDKTRLRQKATPRRERGNGDPGNAAGAASLREFNGARTEKR